MNRLMHVASVLLGIVAVSGCGNDKTMDDTGLSKEAAAKQVADWTYEGDP